MFDWNVPIDRRAFQRAALPWLVVPFIWAPLVALIVTALNDRPTMDPLWLVVWLPALVAKFGLVVLSMRRLLDLGVTRLVA